MHPDYILIGSRYKVTAPDTSAREWWTVLEKRQNTKTGEWEIICRTPNKASSRIFRAESFKDMKNDKKIITHPTGNTFEIDGMEIVEEEIEQMPFHKKRGRKPKAKA